MKRANEGARIAAHLATDWHTPMTTDVEQHSYLSVFIADDNHGLARQLQEFEVTDAGKFTLMGNVVPDRAIHAFLELPHTAGEKQALGERH